MEIWKDVEGYEGYYQVSSLGRIKSLERVVARSTGKTIVFKESILSPSSYPGEYSRVYLFVNSKKKSKYIHRLIAQAFIPNLENKPEVNHKDGDKSNNNKSNLEWATRSENMRHAVDTKLLINKRGEEVHTAKLTEEGVLKIREMLKSGVLSDKEIASMFGIKTNTLYYIRKRLTWKHV